MNGGKILILSLGLSALIAGVAMYYLQVYAYYEEVAAEDASVVLTRNDGATEEVGFSGFEGIDSDSSPLRYRACFDLELSEATLTETYQVYEGATPLVAPGWFECFDAQTIGQALEEGAATAFLGEENFSYGFDRVVALMPDGRAYAWHQINRCGERVFDGEAAPEGCPPVPERLQ